MASRITQDGQVTIPQDILETLGVSPGDQVDFKRVPDGSVVLENAARASRRSIDWSQVRGSAGPGPSTDEWMKLLRGDD